MSLLTQITTGRTEYGKRIVLAGQEKMGKTTLGCYAPDVLLIPLEVGFASTNVAKVPMIQQWEVLDGLINEIIGYAQQGSFPYKSIFFDSYTATERLIHEYVIRLDHASKGGANKSVTMESAHGGYGKAYNMANSIFEDFLKKLDLLAIHGKINIVGTAHVFSSKFNDPIVGEYSTWELLLHSPKNEKTYGKREILTQWADMVGFIYEPLYLVNDTKDSTARGISQNVGRVIGVSRTPSYIAGNRFNITGEIALPPPNVNGWDVIMQAIETAKTA